MNIILIILFSILGWLIIDFIKKNSKERNNEAPNAGLALPLIGHLYLLNKLPHRSFLELSNKYGGIFKMWMGNHKALIINDLSIARDVYIKHFDNFNSRPKLNNFKIFTSNFNDVIFSGNEIWSKNRKLISSAFTKTKIKTTNIIIEQQTSYLIDTMNTCLKNNQFYAPQKHSFKLTTNIISGNVFNKIIPHNEEIEGSESEGGGFVKKVMIPIQKCLESFGAANPDNFISILSPLYYWKNKKLALHVNNLRNYLSEIYDDHLLNLDYENPKNLMDQMIIASDGNDKDSILQISSDFLIGGVEANAATIDFLTMYLINNQDVQELVYAELVNVFGKDCSFIEAKDRNSCPYLAAVIKETFRMCSIGPVLAPRIAAEDVEINGYCITKGTSVYVNLYGINKKYVDDPFKFKPERWIEYKNKKVNGQFSNSDNTDFHNDLDKIVLPFSMGKRNCPGIAISESLLFCVAANIFLNFKLQSTDSNKINETENSGLVATPIPYSIKLTKRI